MHPVSNKIRSEGNPFTVPQKSPFSKHVSVFCSWSSCVDANKWDTERKACVHLYDRLPIFPQWKHLTSLIPHAICIYIPPISKLPLHDFQSAQFYRWQFWNLSPSNWSYRNEDKWAGHCDVCECVEQRQSYLPVRLPPKLFLLLFLLIECTILRWPHFGTVQPSATHTHRLSCGIHESTWLLNHSCELPSRETIHRYVS